MRTYLAFFHTFQRDDRAQKYGADDISAFITGKLLAFTMASLMRPLPMKASREELF
jgi:hypothetical protein